MNKSLLTILLAFLGSIMSVYSQDNGGLPSWWKEANKETPAKPDNKDAATDTANVVVGASPIKISNESDSYLLDCIRPAFSIIKEQYQIKDIKSDTFHGKNSMNYFGESYSLAVLINKGYIFTQLVMAPWDYDEDYAAVNNRGKTPQYQGVQYETYIREAGDSTFVKYNLDPRYITTMVPDHLYDFDTGSRVFGMSVDRTDGEKSGVLIVCGTDTPLSQNPSAELVMTAKPLKINVVKGEAEIFDLNDINQSNVLGGIFVTPMIPQAGSLIYCIAGVMTLDKDGSWKLVSTGYK